MNLDGGPLVRRFILDNAAHWVREYHVDGLRLDATHALIDETARHPSSQELAEVTEAVGTRPIIVHAEDHRNLAVMVRGCVAGRLGISTGSGPTTFTTSSAA